MSPGNNDIKLPVSLIRHWLKHGIPKQWPPKRKRGYYPGLSHYAKGFLVGTVAALTGKLSNPLAYSKAFIRGYKAALWPTLQAWKAIEHNPPAPGRCKVYDEKGKLLMVRLNLPYCMEMIRLNSIARHAENFPINPF